LQLNAGVSDAKLLDISQQSKQRDHSAVEPLSTSDSSSDAHLKLQGSALNFSGNAIQTHHDQ
jgi:hypothetical protein